ncbi:[bacterium]|nr:[FeFe] hydrogenase H-cluster maturation GTPase HydF [bacterium]
MKTARGNRIHIGLYGKRNVGKSTIFNILLGQDFSIVSDVLGTTTDSVVKAIELQKVGAVSLIDTAGFDDIESLGNLRVEKTKETLLRADCVIFVLDNNGLENSDIEFLNEIKEIPTLAIINKQDEGEISQEKFQEIEKYFKNIIKISALKISRDEFLTKIEDILAEILKKRINELTSTLPEILKSGDFVHLVIPIDKEAPKGRLILPQVQVLRDLLDLGCSISISGVENLKETVENLKQAPKLVITDSQAFREVEEILPKNILLTSFSILFANLKGDIKTFINGAKTIDNLRDGDKILILESCTHHAIEDDIGRVKIPNLVKKYTSKNLIFEHYSGCDFPKNIEEYALIIHCGACMTNRNEILNRIKITTSKNVPITNYGIIISKCLGILNRAVEVFNLI